METGRTALTHYTKYEGRRRADDVCDSKQRHKPFPKTHCHKHNQVSEPCQSMTCYAPLSQGNRKIISLFCQCVSQQVQGTLMQVYQGVTETKSARQHQEMVNNDNSACWTELTDRGRSKEVEERWSKGRGMRRAGIGKQRDKQRQIGAFS